MWSGERYIFLPSVTSFPLPKHFWHLVGLLAFPFMSILFLFCYALHSIALVLLKLVKSLTLGLISFVLFKSD